MATTFPNSVQTFPTMQDVTATDMAAIKQYQQAMQDGNLRLAQSILLTISNYDKKIITADLLNTIADTCVALEEYYATKYSPAYVVSSTQPSNQQATDFWFKVV